MKVKASVKVTNNFTQVRNATTTDLANALYMFAEEVMTYAKIMYVPVQSGALKRSGFVNKPVKTPTRITVEIGFNTPYALKVHEYPKSYGQGKNKYLSQPLNRMSANMDRRIRQLMRMSIGTP